VRLIGVKTLLDTHVTVGLDENDPDAPVKNASSDPTSWKFQPELTSPGLGSKWLPMAVVLICGTGVPLP
jgi:hypothetical protein